MGIAKRAGLITKKTADTRLIVRKRQRSRNAPAGGKPEESAAGRFHLFSDRRELMAKLECELHGNFNEILSALEEGILNGSASASMEEESNFATGSAVCAVRVYERYSFTGGNRVSLNLTLLQSGGRIFLSAIASGGSQAVFWKINTFGEEAFLDTIQEVVAQYMPQER